MLELEMVSAGYGAVVAVRDITLHINRGEFVTLIGSNGAGKSTILRTISGLIKPRQGTIRFEGKRIDGLAPHSIVRAGIAHVPEGRHVFPDLSVAENLEMGGFIWRREPAQFREALDLVYSMFPKLAQRRAQMAGTLSGGEQQMLAVGRALMSRPRLLLLDEPSLGLAPKIVLEMFNLFAHLHRTTGLTILLVEQLAALTLEYTQRGYVLERGEIKLSDSSAALRSNPRVQQIYLGA
ncbi:MULTISPECIES: ABC transporter ATP-binding protein [Roseiflexus]|jgi:branched-chain amino acid transport system ATP-binding protein|uniref:ABC transporter related n=1 Tax=Roseiflexus castenholzii (strain DSM 13941 / HLO8) TaxID=383372 RepID=A7NPQ2_ROSCS|nr:MULTISPECIES: ABC transporter ATP-binding protein [Roseiflexus]ABU59548.1 ABC transporter related [Roseiflexus castenholzii DSM 13941]GIW02650.1 MAG: ABC transporter ATP-binding protein [Roseiflexus sp.]